MKTRADCARLVAGGAVRLNRQPTEKAHARLRPGDILTVASRGQIRVLRVQMLASRRGPPAEAGMLYEEIPPEAACAATETAALPAGASEPSGSP